MLENKVDTPRGRGQSRRLSKEIIVESAVGLLDANGWESFSLRRLAEELRVHVTSLYQYFETKEALLAAVWQRVHDELEHEPDPNAGWRAHLRTSMRSYSRMIVRHPYLPLLSPYATMGIAGTHTELELKALASDGFEPEEAALAFNTLRVFAVGAAMNELFGAKRPEARLAPTLEATPESLPHLARSSRFLRTNWPAVFDFGLEALLDAIEVRHAANQQRDTSQIPARLS